MFDKFVWNEFIRHILVAHLSGHHAQRDVQNMLLQFCEHRGTMAPKGWNSWMSGIAGQTRQIYRDDYMDVGGRVTSGTVAE